MEYDYAIGDFIENSPDLENSIDPEAYLQFKNNPFKVEREIQDIVDKNVNVIFNVEFVKSGGESPKL